MLCCDSQVTRFGFDHYVWYVCCSEFVKVAGQGGKGITPIQTMPVLEQTQAWDGKDGEIIEEDEFSLEDLMSES